MISYQVSQDVVVALCILALFDDLKGKVRGDTENKMPVTHTTKTLLVQYVCITEREGL